MNRDREDGQTEREEGLGRSSEKALCFRQVSKKRKLMAVSAHQIRVTEYNNATMPPN